MGRIHPHSQCGLTNCKTLSSPPADPASSSSGLSSSPNIVNALPSLSSNSTMDQPQVHVSGTEDPDSNVNTTNANATEVEMGGTQDTANDGEPRVNSTERTEAKQQQQQHRSMRNQDQDPAPPAKTNAGLEFLE